MRYTESMEKSAEYLRRAIANMTKQNTALHPVNYTIWYEYAAGINRGLNQAIEEILDQGKVLDEHTTWQLYRTHIAEIDDETAHEVSNSLQQMLVAMENSAATADAEARRFGSSLEKWSAELDAQGNAADMHQVRGDTAQMQGAISALQERLQESQKEVLRLKQEVTSAREDALSDGLTGLVNRRGFDMALANCLSDMGEAAVGPSLLITDIDHFKHVNDTYGHLFGDKVIQTVAAILKANVKGVDIAARYGGEEFVVLLPETPLEGARVLAEKIRSTIERSRIRRHGQNAPLESVTVSLGVSCYLPGEPANDFVARADKALYMSKEGGRNRVTVMAPA